VGLFVHGERQLETWRLTAMLSGAVNTLRCSGKKFCQEIRSNDYECRLNHRNPEAYIGGIE
jgi:hypothetical protein